jgi:hypothetical protein
MYNIVLNRETQALDVMLEDRMVLKGLKPLMNVDGRIYELPLRSFDSDTAEYGNDDMSLSLIFRAYRGATLFRVRADLKKGFLEPIGGVKLHIDAIGKVEGLMANYLHKDWWTRPWFDTDIEKIPPRTQSLVWKDGAMYHHILPVCDEIFRAELSGADSGMEITLSAYDAGYNSCDTLAFVLASDADPFKLVKTSSFAGLKSLKAPGKTIDERPYPDELEYLGWCSWDAFYHDVNHQGLLDKAREFHDKGIPVRWFIIDDGWSETEDRKLKSFDADSDKFPEGLAGVISKLKEQYGVNWVGVWHAFTGYWDGIAKDGALAKEFKENIYTTKAGRLIPYPDVAKGFAFWNAWHSYLASKGVDFVKVDNQSSLINFIKYNMPAAGAASGMHDALEASVGLNFGGLVINCMGMAQEDLWHRRASAVSRNSDDFLPHNEGSFREHALQNAYNSYIYGNFIWGDWDMWWTSHPQAVNNAVLRAISGGPVYISDPVGKTSGDMLKPLMLSNGRILRCKRPGVPTADCLMRDPCSEPVPLKIWNKAGNAGIIAAFNINNDGLTVSGSIRASDIPGLTMPDVAVYEHFSRSARIISQKDEISFELKNDGVALYQLVPLNAGRAILGLIDKYISSAAVKYASMTGGVMDVILSEGGQFGFVSLNEPAGIYVNGTVYGYGKDDVLYLVNCDDIKGPVHIKVLFDEQQE